MSQSFDQVPALTLAEAGRQARQKATLNNPNMMSITVLLTEFRRYLEQELGASLADCELNGVMVLSDLCEFLGLGDLQRQAVIGPDGLEALGEVPAQGRARPLM